ncbi:hypothetical protein JTE90_013368 [Oedothorax gibbosus]|uniref:C2H2-type domain-containing protein n=1 Tax=Oedothorax gibbosus TaxID=931172 RepID=A0AAV6TWL3_9ARAC|nr:hypothetical protein JTE90_013368 [Oedothorax gibbosus]
MCHEWTPSKVSDHACFKDHPHVLSLVTNLQFRCQSCDFSSSSKRGLTNHQAAHKRIMATPNVSLPQKAQNRNRKPRELLTAAQIRANQDQTWRDLHFPQVAASISTSNRFQMLEDHERMNPLTHQSTLLKDQLILVNIGAGSHPPTSQHPKTSCQAQLQVPPPVFPHKGTMTNNSFITTTTTMKTKPNHNPRPRPPLMTRMTFTSRRSSTY